MPIQNRDGVPVDPVPFGVSAMLTFMLVFSIGPVYAQAYGFSLPGGITISTAVFVVSSGVAYYRLVWTATPGTPRVAVDVRLERLLYLMLAMGTVLVGITVPLLL